MARYQVLLKDKREKLLRIVQVVGLDPRKFKWEEEVVKSQAPHQDDQVISKLVYLDSPHFFSFDMHGELFRCQRCPGEELTTEYCEITSWEGVLHYHFVDWIKRLKSQIETPDRWAEAQKYQSLFISMYSEGGVEDIPLSHTEAERIVLALSQVEKEIIEEFNPTPEQLQFIESKRSYLESRARQGYPRIDWVNLLMATLITVVAALSLEPEEAQRLWKLYQRALRSVVGLTGLLR